MHHKCETSLMGSGASRNSCEGCFQDAPTLFTFRAQHLIGRRDSNRGRGLREGIRHG